MRLKLFVTAAAMLSASLAAHADMYDYSFDYSVDNTVYASFTLTSPTLITTETGLFITTCSEHVFNDYPCYGADIIPENGEILLSINPDEAEEITGLPRSFFQLGDNTFGNDTLDIVAVPDSVTAVTPEPSSFLLLGTGLLGTVGVIRKRFA